MRRHPRSTALLLAALLAAASIARAQPADTLSREPLFTNNDLGIAAAFALGTVLLFPLDREFARSLQGEASQSRQNVERAVTEFNRIAFPGSIIIGGSLYIIGRATDTPRLADLGLHGTEAILVGLVLGSGLKSVFGRARPYHDVDDANNFRFMRGLEGDRYRSFPSGHSIAAFAAAAAVTAEVDRLYPDQTWWVIPVMFGGATAVGFSRMFDNRHWASDVVTGAAIGSFAGWKIVRYHHTRPGNRIDELMLGVTIVPGAPSAYRLWVVPRRR